MMLSPPGSAAAVPDGACERLPFGNRFLARADFAELGTSLVSASWVALAEIADPMFKL
jgi:hypothetical protein